MARKSTEIRELARALKAPAFGNRDTGELPTELDPVSPTTLVLSLADIEPYEHNPRRAENPEFDRLKDSIASRRGLTTPLTVTKRPGDKRYTIAAGGNSRLRALNELYTETGDQAFNRVTCQFEPWESDCHVLASHLIENEVRGNMTFADKALAVVQWCRLYEGSHAEQPPLTQRALVERLCEAGFEISRTSLIRLLSANEYLLPYLPKAFGSGLGAKAVDQLIRLRKLAQVYWRGLVEARDLHPSTSSEAVFAQVCEAQDCHCDDWLYELFLSALAQAIAQALKVNPKAVTLDLESLSRGHPIDAHASVSREVHEGGSDDGWIFERAREHEKARLERQRERAAARAQREGNSEPTDPSPSDSDITRAANEAARTAISEIKSPIDLRQGRSIVHARAHQIAGRYELGSLVRDGDIGCGFWIEPPEPPTALRGASAWVWWWIAACAQQLDPSHLAVIRRHHSDAWLVQLLDGAAQHLPGTAPRAALGALVGQLDIAEIGKAFLCSDQITDDDFESLQALLRCCRQLYLAAQRAGVPVWD